MKKNKKCRIKRTGLAAVLACAVLLGKGPIWNVQAEKTIFVRKSDLQETEFFDENGCEIWFEDEDEKLSEKGEESLEEESGETLSGQRPPGDAEAEAPGEDNNREEGSEEYPGDIEGEASADPEQEDDAEEPEDPESEDIPGETPEAPEQEGTEGEESETPNQEETENPQEVPEADFVLRAEAQTETAKAGEKLLYRVTAENTGDLPLENLSFRSNFGEKELSAIWENLEGEPLTGENSGVLDAGQSRGFYLSVALPEDLTAPVTLDLTADAWYYPEIMSGAEAGNAVADLTDTFSAESVSEEHNNRKTDPQTEPAVISREFTVTTPVTALKADFKVTKTADRAMAAPGDRVLFQICIQNTGERTLHSVLTTEKFQMEGVPVEFLEKEGVTLNKSKTKALISKLEPDSSFSLQAVVQLPENVKEQELINEVEVITAETGSHTVTSQATVPICVPKPTKPPVELSTQEPSDPAPQARQVSDNPKTGDASLLEIWLCVLAIAFLIAVFLQTKH